MNDQLEPFPAEPHAGEPRVRDQRIAEPYAGKQHSGEPRAGEQRAGFGLAEAVRLGFQAGFVALLLLAAGWAASDLRQVPPDSRAVVQRFGQIERVQEAGLVLAWPNPIEQITLVPAYDRQVALKIDVPANSGPTEETDFQVRQPDDVVTLRHQKDAWNGQYFLTGDGSVVQFDATLYFRVTDPGAYVLSREHVAPALQRLYRASAATLASGHDLDDFLVARPEDAEHPGTAEAGGRRAALRGDMVTAINQRLAALRQVGSDLGVEVSRIDIVALLPPLAKAAFNDVLTASQIADQTVAAARTDAAHTIQEAQRGHDRSASEAAAAAEEQIRAAAAETADVGVLHGEITPANRDSLLGQYYRDRIGAVLRKIGHVTTVDLRGGQPIIIQGPEE
jgi:regulator of protease activity HflC (stomatin/prohibitin superfamily)